jgi:hypothetical protein
MNIPEIYMLNNDGYPTEGYLKFIREYTGSSCPIMNMIDIICENWYHGDWGWKLHRKYKGVRKFELHTDGWSGNEDIIDEITSNIYLTNFQMKYVSWRTGGHYYFEIKL